MAKLTPKDRINNLLSESLDGQLLPLKKELDQCKAEKETILDEYVNVKASMQALIRKSQEELEAIRRELELAKGELESEKAVNDTLRSNAEAMSIELKKYQDQGDAEIIEAVTTPKADKKTADKKPK